MTPPEEEEVREHLTDDIDRASALEMMENASSVNAIRQKAKQDQLPDTEGRYMILDCVDCGGEIGIERIRVSLRNTLCVGCATARERRR